MVCGVVGLDLGVLDVMMWGLVDVVLEVVGEGVLLKGRMWYLWGGGRGGDFWERGIEGRWGLKRLCRV